MAHSILVFGAINIDVSVTTSNPYVLADSNPANMSFSVGGVGANIAMNLAMLGQQVDMVTTLGDNPFYHLAIQELKDAGVHLSHAKRMSGLPTNFYMSVLDDENDLFLGLNDMKGIDSLDHGYVLDLDIDPASYDAVVLDNNLSEELLIALAKEFASRPLYIDTVSLKKAPKVLPIVPYLNVLKCNDMEFKELKTHGFDPIKHPNLITIVTNHDKPITIYTNHEKTDVPVTKADTIVSTSGAGDALLSGIIDATVNGLSILPAVIHGTTIATKVIGRKTSSLKGQSI